MTAPVTSSPSPALVAQDAVRRLPRWALWLLCLGYVIPGFVGRDPWREEDLASFGLMRALAQSSSLHDWLHPALLGHAGDVGALLPYWLGAWALQLAPAWMAPDFVVRLPFVLMLIGVLAGTWYATYYLAQDTAAAPVSFAFGGEASGKDYARALADGSALALVATLGLAQFSHETTPALAQLFFSTLAFYGFAVLPVRPRQGGIALPCGFIGLSASGAPMLAAVYALVVLGSLFLPITAHLAPVLRRRARWIMGGITASCALLLIVNATRWRMPEWRLSLGDWDSLGQLLIWFTWPAWPFVLWALWRWRRQLRHPAHNRHLGLPLLFAGAPLAASVVTLDNGRTLFLALPALAALAAFALPTFKRSATALIDWFTVLFFSIWAIIIWVVWISLQTGVPAKPAANVARLGPGFEPSFQLIAFLLALLATLAWLALARWRTARYRPALWKSLVLPAAGTTLCWILLTTLWLPGLNYGRSLAPQISAVRDVVGHADCIVVQHLSAAQVAAIQFHGGWRTVSAGGSASKRRSGLTCSWLITAPQPEAQPRHPDVDTAAWQFVAAVPRPTRQSETLRIYRRAGGAS